jgi:choline dehydrogenase
MKLSTNSTVDPHSEIPNVEFAKRVEANQTKLRRDLRSHYDFIVCGSGSSGSVVAGRLAANPEVSVLLLEAGGSDDTELITNPNRWPMTLGGELDWGFVAAPNSKLNGRAIPYSMGKVLGGGSSINVSTWSRGHRVDWDFYASESRETSWGYEAVLDLIAVRLKGGLEVLIRGIGARAGQSTCSRPQTLTRFLWPYWRAQNPWG